MVKKQNVIILIWEAPALIFLLSSGYILNYFIVHFGFQAGIFLFYISLSLMGIATAVLYLLTKLSASSKVSGKRFLVGVAYEENGIADYVELPLGEYTLLAEDIREIKIGDESLKFEFEDGKGFNVYGVYEEDSDKISYILITVGDIEDVLNVASVWDVEAGWWYAKAQVYPVSLLKTNLKAIDVKRLDEDLDPSIPIYIVRDSPGFVVEGSLINNVSSEIAVEGRRAVDSLRSAELYYENLALREELQSYQKTNLKIDALATAKAQAYIKAHLENRKEHRGWGFRLGKWEAFVIIAIIISVLVYILFRMWRGV